MHSTDSGMTPAGICDVLVVGGGGSGLTAAIFAARAGARVILLEKNPHLGGTTILSVGSITAAGTSWQRRKGIADNPDDHFEDMEGFLGPMAGKDNYALRRLYVDNVTVTLEWLGSIGVSFFGPMPEPPHRVPRMHNVLPNSRAYGYHLGKEARRQGVDIRLKAPVQDLVMHEGRVIGAVALVGGRPQRFLARRGVILASGDISSARDFREEFRPDLREVEAVNPNSTGDGQRIVRRMGGRVINGNLMLGPSMRFKAPAKENFQRRLPPWRVLTRAMELALDNLPMAVFRPFVMSFMTSSMAPEPQFFQAGAILVNAKGERFTDETQTPGNDIARQPGKYAWVVFDDRLARQFSGWPHFISTAPGLAYAYFDDYRRTRADLYRTAPTLEGLAAAMGVPAGTLAAQARASGPASRTPLTQGPFHALGPLEAWIVVADGGVAVDPELRVLGADDQPIPGLFAAGSAGQGGAVLWGHGHHIGWATTSGRLAGQRVAALPDMPLPL